MSTVVIIPARENSRRLPGKVLSEGGGKPMLAWTALAAKEADIGRVIVATDSDRIAAAAKQYDLEYVMTSHLHQNGTSRCMEALDNLGLDPDIMLNVQADEPEISPVDIKRLAEQCEGGWQQCCWTLAGSECGSSEQWDEDSVKVICGSNGRAIYFTRAPVPLANLHVGAYAFTSDARRYTLLTGGSRLAAAERLEQLEWLDAGMPIHVLAAQHPCRGVNNDRELRRWKRGRQSHSGEEGASTLGVT